MQNSYAKFNKYPHTFKCGREGQQAENHPGLDVVHGVQGVVEAFVKSRQNNAANYYGF